MKSNPNSAVLNENYYEDSNLNIQLLKWILKSIGAWPNAKNEKIGMKILFDTLIIISCFVLSATVIPCTLFSFIEEKDSYRRFRSLGQLCYLIGGALRYYILLASKDMFQRCMDHLQSDWKSVNISEHRQAMLDKTYASKKIVNTCAIFLYGSVMFFNSMMSFANGKIQSEDGKYLYQPLPFGFAKMIVDPRPSPNNEIIIFIQYVCTYIITTTTAAACCSAAVFVLHACGQLDVLVLLLHRIINDNDKTSTNVDDRITDVVKHHVRVLKFIKNIDQLLRNISLLEIAESTMNICSLGYFFIMEWNSEPANALTYITLIISLLFNVFIFCYIGELLNGQYKKVADMTYMIDWHRIPGKKGLSLILIMTMSNASKKMTAGSLFDLQMTSFSDIVRSTVGFLNFLRATTT